MRQVGRRIIEALNKWPARPSHKALVESLASSPITAEATWSSQRTHYLIIAYLLLHSEFIVVGLAWLLSGNAVAVTIVSGVVIVVGSNWLLYNRMIGSQRGLRMVADGERLTLSKRESVLWAVPWSELRIVNHQLFGERKHVLLSDGRKGIWPSYIEHGSGACGVILRITSEYVVSADKGKPDLRRTVSILVIAAAAMAWAAWRMSPGNGGFGDPERTAPFGAIDLANFVVLAVGLTLGMIGGIRLLIIAERPKPVPNVTLVDFIYDSAMPLPPTELQVGVVYCYVDPKALREKFRLSFIYIIGALFPAMFLVMAIIEPSRESTAIAVSSLLVLGSLAFVGVRRFRYERAFLQYFDDKIWLVEEALHVKRADREFSFPFRPFHNSNLSWETASPTFMSWYEHFANDQFGYLLDRRFLIPDRTSDPQR